MTLVVDKFRTLLPSRIKSSPSGWFSFNAPCCQHRGHKPDTRKRAGIRFDGEGIVYNCFNCKYTTGWQPGSLFGEKMKSLCRWLGADEDQIKELMFESLKTETLEDRPITEFQSKVIFENKSLPEGSMPLLEWVNSEYWNDISVEVEPIISYVHDRGLDPVSGNFYWSPSAGYESRVIIPFLYEGRIVGNTARKITNGKPKYLSDQHPNFVFNLDNQYNDNKYCFVVEGPFDALSIGGVALLTNEISIQQAKLINDIEKEIIVIPDQDRAGLNVISQAAELGWSVSFPNWEDDIKDVADAINRYGKMFVIVDLLLTAERNAIKIDMAKRNLIRKLDLGENNV
jgi:hypothetical protein